MNPENRARLTRGYLRYVSRGTKPILLGPWRSEVGFESLYWLPFLRWFVKSYDVDVSRLFTITRGGANLLYGTAGIDLYDLRSVKTVRLENQYDWERTKLQKQMGATAWDRDVLKEAAAHLLGRGEKYHVLHPSWMYWALEPFWNELRGLQHLVSMADYEPIVKPKPAGIDLPPSYVAMKWYERPTFPAQDDRVRDLIGRLVGVVGAQTKIVLLSGTPEADDHIDIEVTHPNIVAVPPAAPEKNLAQQAQILAHASAFVGTYGGMAQLALRLGVPSVSFYKDFGQTAHAHLSLSSIISKKTKVPFLCGSLDDADGWTKVLSLPMVKEAA